MSTKNILFIRSGSFSNINNSVLKILQDGYPDYQIETIDVQQVLKKNIRKYHFIINIFFFLKEYGRSILMGQKRWKTSNQWFLATSYISIIISKEIKKLKKSKNFTFTFQTQSIFNGKLENVPNFIYTDHTTKTNFLYPHIKPEEYIRSKRFIEKFETELYKEATLIFTLGSLAAQSLISQYDIPKEKVVPVFAGSNVTRSSDNNLTKYFSKNILFVGVEWERKGGPTLLAAFRNILKTHPDTTLTIVGCNPKNITLPNCKVIGKIPVNEISKYYDCASIFCLPTVREPFGIVFIEAMKYRLPIVANKIGSIPDLVINDYNGFLIDNNVRQYTDILCKLLSNPEKCQQMGENGYQYFKSNFTWDEVGKKITKNINKAIGE